VQSVLLILLVILMTSVVACAIGVKWLGLDCLALGRAGLKTLDTVGIGAIFFGANLATGITVIALIRTLTGSFVSHYTLSDVSLLGFSLLQGVVFAWWHSASGQGARSQAATPSRPPGNERTAWMPRESATEDIGATRGPRATGTCGAATGRGKCPTTSSSSR
jgi:hypothetical protein